MPTEVRYKNFEFHRSLVTIGGTPVGHYGSYVQSIFRDRNYIAKTFSGWKFCGLNWGLTFKQFNHADSDFKTCYGRRVTTLTNINNGATLVSVSRYRSKYGGGSPFTEPNVFTPSQAAYQANGGAQQTGSPTTVSPTLQNWPTTNPANYTCTVELQEPFTIEEAFQIVRDVANGTPEPNYTDIAAGNRLYGDSYRFSETVGNSGVFAPVLVAAKQSSADADMNNPWMVSTVGAILRGTSTGQRYEVYALKLGFVVTGGIIGAVNLSRYCRSQWTYKGNGIAGGGTFTPHENCQMLIDQPLQTTQVVVDLPTRNPDVSTRFVDAYAYAGNQIFFPGYSPTGYILSNQFPKVLPPPGPCCQLT